MRLLTDVPGGWQREHVAHGTQLVAPGGEIKVLVTELFAPGKSPEEWLRLAVGAPGTLSHAATPLGWAYTLLETGGEQPRLGALLDAADFAGAIIAHCRSARRRPGWREDILALIHSARPDFRQTEAACLAEQVLA